MSSDLPEPSTRAQDEALEELLQAMSDEELRVIEADPDAAKALIREADLRAAQQGGYPRRMAVASSADESRRKAPDSESSEAIAPEEPYELNQAEAEAFEYLLAEMSYEELQVALADPEALQALATEARLKVAIEGMDDDQLASAGNRFFEATDGPLFTADEWALILEQPGFRHLATDPTARAKFEFQMRQDPDEVETIKRLTADVVSVRGQALSPGAKQFLLRIGIGLVIGLIVLSQSRN